VPISADDAASHVTDIHRMVAAAFPGKEILLGEVGWPSAGRMREGALPSPVNQARVIEDVLAVGKREGFRANVIEAFDQPWKRQLEGTVGGHWGVLDGESRAPKFAWGAPLSNHPGWAWQAAVGVFLATAVLLAAGLAARRTITPLTRAHWFGVAATALVPGVLIGWAVANVPLESLGVSGWIHSLAMVTLALISPVAGAAALMRGIPGPSFSQVLGHWKDRPPARVGWVLGVCWIVLCALATEVALGLAFDPRYRDFPFAPLGAAAAPFLILELLGAGARRRELAEIIMAAVLAASTAYIAWNEGPANWQSLCLCGVFAAIVITLLRPRAEPSSK
jgi:glucan 1,3-beta-glucosidase